MKRPLGFLLGGSLCALVALAQGITWSMRPLPSRLEPPEARYGKRQVVDREGQSLSYTFTRGWNYSDQRPLHAIPESVQRAFIEAEDHRFYDHVGVDWWARLNAIWQGMRALRFVRGASTISEQVVRMLHPRPRTVWSRLVEGFEARALERSFSKGEILEFYLNQVPFGAQRRGVVQAARYFWDREIDTLSEREVLALAVMVRAPDRLDLYKNPKGVDSRLSALADRLVQRSVISQEARASLNMETLQQSRGELAVQADHLIRYVQGRAPERSGVTIKTTISSELQQRVQEILDTRLRALAEMNVTNGAVLVVDNRTAEVLAWVNGVASLDGDGSQIDAITTLRQPGSSLKPFLYAAALEKGWSPSTVITDAPLAEGVGAGLHSYRNYSRIHYGELPLREALGNSLNIPAIKTIQYVGNREFLSFLRHAGFSSLDKGPEFYGEGLALGNGEVSLLELVQGYVMLANRGRWRPLRVVFDEGATPEGERQIVSPEVSSLIGNILADPNARRREFGSGGLLRFPVQTAVKTGTSTDYRDAWVVGYTDRYTVGVWMGNLNRLSMRDVTGAKGPALVLRTVFADLQRLSESRPLYLAPTLARRTVCPHSGKLAGERCPHVEELFVPGTEPSVRCDHNHGIERGERPHRGALGPPLRISMPTPGLHIARDPRIPDHLEAVPFEVESSAGVSEITWIVDGKEVARTGSGITKWSWSPVEGRHTVRAVASIAGSSDTVTSHEVGFWVR